MVFTCYNLGPRRFSYSLETVKSGQTANLRPKSVSSKLNLAHSRCDISHSEARDTLFGQEKAQLELRRVKKSKITLN